MGVNPLFLLFQKSLAFVRAREALRPAAGRGEAGAETKRNVPSNKIKLCLKLLFKYQQVKPQGLKHSHKLFLSLP